MTQEALKLAIQLRDTASGYWTEHEIPIIENLIELLAQPEQEPVTTVDDNSQKWAGMDGAIAFHLIERHADGWNDIRKMMGEWLSANTPQRTWQGLTDEEIAQGCKESWVTEQAWQSAVWWAEAKLKEKNT